MNYHRISPSQGVLTPRSGTITLGGTAQVMMAANKSRQYLLIINPSLASEQGIGAAEDIWIGLIGTAVIGSPSIRIGPGDSFVMESSFVSSAAVSVIAATTGHKWTAKEA